MRPLTEHEKALFIEGCKLYLGGNEHMATKPAVGSRVRLTAEGTVTGHVPASPFNPEGFSFKTDSGQVVFHNSNITSTKVEVLAPPKPVFEVGKRYRSTPQGTYEGVRTSFGKWLITKHFDPTMIGEVLTDEKFDAAPYARGKIIKSLVRVD